ncbi:hypothetical protein [Streptomyces sp. NPDC020983]|uniref:hypothetical protein n=1 Tax=Streptomyces sp. NPDC020983 TaxID=3365106 RepID=UPI0037B96D7E
MEDRTPEKILHALTLRDRDEVRAKCRTPLWKEFSDPVSGIEFFVTLDGVLALAAGIDTAALEEGSYAIGGHPFSVELTSESEVLFTFNHAEPPRHGSSPAASRRAAELLYSAAHDYGRSSDRGTHVATRYATGEWTTVEVLGPEDLPQPSALDKRIGTLVHQFDLTTWTLDQALPTDSAV